MQRSSAPCKVIDFTIVGNVRNHEAQVKVVATALNLGGWVSTAASGNLIGRGIGREVDIVHFKWWLHYVAPGHAMTQDAQYYENITTKTEDLTAFDVI